MKKLFCLSFSLLCAMQLLAQRGANTPFVGTGVPTVSFSALSSNAIYDMIISYGGGGGGGGWTGNPNQFNANGSYTNIKSGALLTNVTIKASGNAPVFETIAQTPDSGLLFQIDNNTVPGWHFTGDVFGYSGSFIGAFNGNGSGLTNLSTTATLGWGTNIAGAGMISNSMPIVQFNGTVLATQYDFNTNLTTYAGPDFSFASQWLVTNEAFVVLAPKNVDGSRDQVTCLNITNSTATAKAITAPANCVARGVWYVTNLTRITFNHIGPYNTNAVADPIF